MSFSGSLVMLELLASANDILFKMPVGIPEGLKLNPELLVLFEMFFLLSPDVLYFSLKSPALILKLKT
jgi:hypothetical protein